MGTKFRTLGVLLVASMIGAPLESLARASAPDSWERQAVTTADQSEIQTVTITVSGVRHRNDTTVIRYRRSDLTIVSVTEDGTAVPPDKFSRYRDRLLKALEYPRIRVFFDRIDAVARAFEAGAPHDPGRREQFEQLLTDLGAFLRQHMSPGGDTLSPRYLELSDLAFTKLVCIALREGQHLPREAEVRLVLRESGCQLNGRALPQDLSREVLRIWALCRGTALEKGERVTYIFSQDRQPEDGGAHAL